MVAPNEKAAAEYYPPIYWYSMLRIPPKSEFPGTGPTGNGINPGQRHQHYWLADVKSLGCMSCHALGTPGTRTIPHEFGRTSPIRATPGCAASRPDRRWGRWSA